MRTPGFKPRGFFICYFRPFFYVMLKKATARRFYAGPFNFGFLTFGKLFNLNFNL